jgi:mRNA-degrading endonuclease toxin of MazEF toxin-antitoxin module
MRQRCVANFDNIHVILRSALRERAGALASERHREIKRALGYAFDWAELKVL